MQKAPSDTTLQLCRELLLPGSVKDSAYHQVLSFSPRRDILRLALVGVLPRELADARASELCWIDLQQHDWGLGPSPGLRAVVRHSLGCDLDKRLQTSDWAKRPLTQKQLD